MANIKVSDMNLAGSELFMDSESFLNDLTDMDVTSVQGGEGYGLGEFYGLNYKVLEAGLVGLGVTNVVSLVKSFSANGLGGIGTGGII
ncbi:MULTISPECIES: hypothetical protein [Nostocales]|uniref:Bacteriocin n=2 Tax=Nostocales TaxID=1161 RepID=A0A0C1NCS9_9CYAN|nr:hypothetical protein [Tolypothrix bouteillei]KAF3886532.1 hypothetical protein DA73_0400014375 [Tolypothrix bouteillei VB521301]